LIDFLFAELSPVVIINLFLNMSHGKTWTLGEICRCIVRWSLERQRLAIRCMLGCLCAKPSEANLEKGAKDRRCDPASERVVCKQASMDAIVGAVTNTSQI